MAVLSCDRIDYRDALSKAVVNEQKKEICIYLNGWKRYVFTVDVIEINRRRRNEKK
ncbi:MAG TPA: hypothetical protein P5031_07550 [Candidatus Syntrophosphaera sp.]|jgi:hypothetical protein|nr:hypothetical protein [Candidatus Syntrophosphaera sp.]